MWKFSNIQGNTRKYERYWGYILGRYIYDIRGDLGDVRVDMGDVRRDTGDVRGDMGMYREILMMYGKILGPYLPEEVDVQI